MRLDGLYDIIAEIEEKIEDAKLRKKSVEAETLTMENIYKILHRFGDLYDLITEEERKQLISHLIQEIQIYPEGESECPLKSIKFNFPVYKDGKEVREVFLKSEHNVETLVLLSKNSDSHINVTVEFGEGEGQISLKEVEKRAEARKPKEKVTYKMIQQYIEENYGFKVHTAYIAEVKRNLGLPMYDAPNAVEELKRPRSHPTEKMVLAIKETLAHFEII